MGRMGMEVSGVIELVVAHYISPSTCARLIEPSRSNCTPDEVTSRLRTMAAQSFGDPQPVGGV